MLPLTIDDLLPLEEFASRRKEFFDAQRRYVDRYRRIRIGPKLTLIFENRQTLWFRVQEIIRVARLGDARDVQLELDLYNRLLPGVNLLQAALLIEIADQTQLGKELALWRSLSGADLKLHVGTSSIASHLITCRPEDRTVGTAHWVQFHLPTEVREAIGDLSQRAHFAFENDSYQHQSPSLGDEFRQSLLDDLNLSERSVELAA
jgi:Protein of unknown function (DUF3501)